jgi:hypothetical protein
LELAYACEDKILEIENYVTAEMMLEMSIKLNLLAESACVAFLDAARAPLKFKILRKENESSFLWLKHKHKLFCKITRTYDNQWQASQHFIC